MISTPSREAVRAAHFGTHWVQPRYDAFGFAHLPSLVQAMLVDDRTIPLPFGPAALAPPYDCVIFFFVDAFGWRFFERYAGHPFLARIARDGAIAQLTSQFPSTTAAHVTTIHSGLPVGEHGVYEWYHYEPRLDAMIAPLLFSYAGDKQRDRLLQDHVRPADLFPRRTVYADFAANGVPSFVFQPAAYARSPFSLAMTRGATMEPYAALPEAITRLGQIIAQQEAPTYLFLYYDTIDTAAHLHGPDSPQVDAQITLFLDTMERSLHAALTTHDKRCLFLMTADHGHTAIDPATTVYLNRELPHLRTWLRVNRRGEPLVPAGSARDFFLHVRDEHQAEAIAALRDVLRGRAEVFAVPDLIERGFFGPCPPSPALRERVGDLVVCPYAGESAWWYEPGRFEQRFYGSHGGLTRDEMETILFAFPYG